MDEDMEGKTHTERQTETETETERIWSGLVQLSLDNNNNNNNERERERDIEHPKERGVGSRSSPTRPTRPGVALLPGGGARKRPNTSLCTEDQIGSGVLTHTHTHTRLCYSVFLVFSLTMMLMLLLWILIIDYGFEYSDEDTEEENVDIENQYYHAKESLEGGEHEDALEGFAKVVDMQEEKQEWGFKALKQIVKLRFKLNQHQEMMEAYGEMLTYVKGSVTRNDAEKKINSLLDFVSTSNSTEVLQEFYDVTLRALQEAKNDRLWFKTNLKLCSLYHKTKDFARLTKTLKELHRSCKRQDGTDDVKKGTQLLEIYAIEIQMYTEQKNNKKLKELYHKALAIKSAIPHPRILGVIR